MSAPVPLHEQCWCPGCARRGAWSVVVYDTAAPLGERRDLCDEHRRLADEAGELKARISPTYPHARVHAPAPTLSPDEPPPVLLVLTPEPGACPWPRCASRATSSGLCATHTSRAKKLHRGLSFPSTASGVLETLPIWVELDEEQVATQRPALSFATVAPPPRRRSPPAAKPANQSLVVRDVRRVIESQAAPVCSPPPLETTPEAPSEPSAPMPETEILMSTPEPQPTAAPTPSEPEVVALETTTPRAARPKRASARGKAAKPRQARRVEITPAPPGYDPDDRRCAWPGCTARRNKGTVPLCKRDADRVQVVLQRQAWTVKNLLDELPSIAERWQAMQVGPSSDIAQAFAEAEAHDIAPPEPAASDSAPSVTPGGEPKAPTATEPEASTMAPELVVVAETAPEPEGGATAWRHGPCLWPNCERGALSARRWLCGLHHQRMAKQFCQRWFELPGLREQIAEIATTWESTRLADRHLLGAPVAPADPTPSTEALMSTDTPSPSTASPQAGFEPAPLLKCVNDALAAHSLPASHTISGGITALEQALSDQTERADRAQHDAQEQMIGALARWLADDFSARNMLVNVLAERYLPPEGRPLLPLLAQAAVSNQSAATLARAFTRTILGGGHASA